MNKFVSHAKPILFVPHQSIWALGLLLNDGLLWINWLVCKGYFESLTA